MRIAQVSVIALILALFVGCATPTAESLRVERTDDAYVLTVPVSRLRMSMPKGGFTQQTNRLGGPTANPRYFYFVDARRALFLSGWFESQERFKGIQALLTEQIVSWRRNGLPAPKNVTFERVGEWQVICYEMQTPIAELCDIHVRASWIQAGTWLDLHLSVASRETKAAAKEKLVDLLRSIRVEEEGAHPAQVSNGSVFALSRTLVR